MDYIKGDYFSVKYPTNKPPEVEGVINISNTFRGGPGSGKLNGIGRPIRVTFFGYIYEEVVSAIQKSIRRGLLDQAMFWGNIMYRMGGPFRSNLINRLIVISSEDIGIGNPLFVGMVYDRLNTYWELCKIQETPSICKKKRKIVLGIVKAAVSSKKSRMCDSIIHAVMEPNVKEFPNGLKKLDFERPKVKRVFKKMPEDSKKFERYMNYFIHAMETGNEVYACHWVQKIFDIPPDKRKMHRRKTYKGSSNDPMYGIWEVLQSIATDKKFKTATSVIE
ncbi:MAG: hypothetical protein JRC86_13260, partial [Deltaproteobacteria bacterium]|nr:hypothetical protein [Deltaproteobacteria bacterium]